MSNLSLNLIEAESLSEEFLLGKAAALKQGESASFRVVLTPDVASTIRTKYNYNGQRMFIQQRADKYALMMRNGSFARHTEIHFGVLFGVPYCINGQHTSAGITLSGVPLTVNINFRVASSESDLNDMYMSHDRGSKRTHAESLQSLAQELDISHEQLKLALAGAKSLLRGIRPAVSVRPHMDLDVRSNDETVLRHFLQINRAIVAAFFSEMQKAKEINRRLFKRADAIACSFLILIYQGNKALEFLHAALQDDELSKDNPAKRLLDWLRSGKTVSNSGHKIAQAFASCWNAYFHELPLTNVHTTTRPSHVFEGTPISFWRDGNKMTEADRARLCQAVFISSESAPAISTLQHCMAARSPELSRAPAN